MRRLLSTTEVAEKLGHTRQWFYLHKKELLEERGFPAPVISQRYDERAIDLWLDQHIPTHLIDGENIKMKDIDIQFEAFDDLLTSRLEALP